MMAQSLRTIRLRQDPGQAEPPRIGATAAQGQAARHLPARGAALALFAAMLALGLLCGGCASLDGSLRDLRTDDNEDRVEAANDLARGLRDGDEDYVAARPRIVEGLRRLLDDGSALVRSVAVTTLAEVETATAVPAIRDRLASDRDVWVRAAAARALGDLRAADGTPELRRALREDESGDVRRTAARALGEVRARPALRDLWLALEDRDRSVRAEARRALVRIIGQDVGDDPKAWRPLLPQGG